MTNITRTNDAPMTRYTDEAASIMERVLVVGDLSKLQPMERVQLYNETCKSLGLNPLTRTFEYIELDRKLTLYARKDATDQLREIHAVSIVDLTERQIGDVYIVTAKARTRDGRTDIATGAVSLVKEGGAWQEGANGKRYFRSDGTTVPLAPDALANAFMRAETKAKRRVTLSICGLGWMDESELSTVPQARAVQVDTATGEIIDQPRQSNPQPPDRRAKIINRIRQVERELIALNPQYEPYPDDDLGELDEQALIGYGNQLRVWIDDAKQPQVTPRPISDGEIRFWSRWGGFVGGTEWERIQRELGEAVEQPTDDAGWDSLSERMDEHAAKTVQE